MPWYSSSSWDPETLSPFVAAHDLNAGTLVVSARPGVVTPRSVQLALLVALGKRVSTRVRIDNDLMTLCLDAWAYAERISDVVLVSAQRWHAPAICSLASVVDDWGVQLHIVTTQPPTPETEALLRDTLGPPRPAVWTQPRARASAPPPAPLDRLRRLVLPVAAAAAVAFRRDARADELAGIAVSALSPGGRYIELGDRSIVVPAGGERFLLAQRRLAERSGSDVLFGIGNRPMRAGDIAFAACIAGREADIDLCAYGADGSD